MRRSALTALLAAGLLAAPWLALGAQAAKLVSAEGNQPGAYGRITLTFDEPVTVKAKLSGSILILSFDRTVAAGPEKIAAGMPDYVAAARRDPDGSAMRLALQRPYRINVQEAGERTFVDLLPDRWVGLPPSLPGDVVADLARRAREAEAALKVRNPPPVPVTLALEFARTPARTRLSLRLPPEADADFEPVGAGTRLTIPGAWRIDERDARGQFDPATGRYSIETDTRGVRLLAVPADGGSVETGRDGDNLTIDFLKAAKAAARPVPAPTQALKPEAKAGAQPAPETDHGPSTGQASNGGQDQASGAAPPRGDAPTEAIKKTEMATAASAVAKAAAATTPGSPAPAPAAATADVVQPRRAGSGLVFPFAKPVPAALFERGGIATLVFETSETVMLPLPVTGGSGLPALAPPKRTGNVTILRFAVPAGKLVDLVPVIEPRGWELAASDTVAPSDILAIRRTGGAGEDGKDGSNGSGRPGISVKLPDPGGATWLDLDGERIAVVTAGGSKRAGLPKSQRFVDFELLPSRVGIAVLALADDLGVRPGLDGVAIERERGLAVSPVARVAEAPVEQAGDLVIDRAAWEAARRSDPRTAFRDALDASIEAPRGQRGTARLTVAKVLMANGFDAEALGALGAAAAEDPVLAGDRQTALMRGILAVRLGRAGEAKKLLSAEGLAANPEARLWRGLARAEAGRWKEADADLRAGAGVLERYPEDAASPLYTAAMEAAVELGDWDAAAQAEKRAGQGATPLTRDRLALLRARIDEAKGGTTAALDAYDTLRESTARPVAAAASLRAALLAQAMGKITMPEAIERLETLAMVWHGGPVEAETLAALGRLYIEAGRWRQAFVAARRSDALAPDAPATRALHDTAQNLFEDLFLGARADKLGGVESLALYFDFKDFAPAGRRADEIVRRLAERLVALDLLDSADALLDHQIEHRLTGQARAGVSAQLAAIRLMEGKPLEALRTLDATHMVALPEDLRRPRTLLRARALSDLTRTDLALETIEDETGPDVVRLRADILWAAQRWREAGEAHEAMLGSAWQDAKPLDDAARADVIRAGIAYGLAGESLGLERLKAKFSGLMAQSADARTFALLTRGDAARSPAFREIARRATTAETLDAFLAEYRKRYPNASLPARGSEQPEARSEAPAGNAPG